MHGVHGMHPTYAHAKRKEEVGKKLWLLVAAGDRRQQPVATYSGEEERGMYGLREREEKL